jgi:hypothetical protein
MASLLNFIASLWILTLLSSCSIFFGNVTPIRKKSHSYTFLNLSGKNKKWVQINQKNTNEASDIVFQSKETQSAISLNTSCESDSEKEIDKKSLTQLTQELLLGLFSNSLTADAASEEKYLTLEKVPALQTTLSTVINRKKLQVRTIVLKKNHCIYDLMYIAPSSNFLSHEDDFKKFVSSLRIN